MRTRQNTVNNFVSDLKKALILLWCCNPLADKRPLVISDVNSLVVRLMFKIPHLPAECGRFHTRDNQVGTYVLNETCLLLTAGFTWFLDFARGPICFGVLPQWV